MAWRSFSFGFGAPACRNPLPARSTGSGSSPRYFLRRRSQSASRDQSGSGSARCSSERNGLGRMIVICCSPRPLNRPDRPHVAGAVVQLAVDLGLRGGADALKLRAGLLVLADADVEVPVLEVDGGVAVEHPDARLAGRADLPGGALDQRADVDVLPLLEAVAEQIQQRLLIDGKLPDLLGAAVRVPHLALRS